MSGTRACIIALALLALLLALPCAASADIDRAGPYVQTLQALVAQSGLANLESSSVTLEDPDENSARWYNSAGVVSALQIDLDGDKADELVVAYITGAASPVLRMRIYAYRSGAVKRVAEVMLDDLFSEDYGFNDLMLVRNGKSTYLLYQKGNKYVFNWGGYYLFKLSGDSLNCVCALRDGAYTATCTLEKMAPVSHFTTMNTYYDFDKHGTILYNLTGRGLYRSKYKKYTTAVKAGLKKYGVKSFSKKKNQYMPRAKVTSKVRQIFTIDSGWSRSTLLLTGKIADRTNLRSYILAGGALQDAPTSGISLSKKKLTYTLGNAAPMLTASVKPRYANQAVSWSSNNPAVAYVSQTGVITAYQKGTATITATATDDRTAKCVVTVRNSPVKYRALLIGNGAYSGSDAIPEAEANAAMIGGMLEHSTINGNKYSRIVSKPNLTKGGMKKQLRAMKKWGIDKNDVTLVYYNGHGANAGGLYGTDYKVLSYSELEKELRGIKGKVVLVLDTCHSGRAIGKALQSKSVETIAGVFGSKSLASSKYHVLAACAGDELAYPEPGTVGFPLGRFTQFVAKAGGYQLIEGRSPMLGDTNGNALLSFSEAYAYASTNVRAASQDAQHVQAYPESSNLAIAGRR